MYNYEALREYVFTEEGKETLHDIRTKTQKLLDVSGAARLKEIQGRTLERDWDVAVCIDRLVELGILQEVTDPEECKLRDRVFVRTQ